MPAETSFQPRTSIELVEERPGPRPRSGEHGLWPCATPDAAGGKVPMPGSMNTEALQPGHDSPPASCHVGDRRRFYRAIGPDAGALHFVEHEQTFEPRVVHGDAPNPMPL